MITEFTPLASLAGGILIGLAATLFMALHGRIAGMTGLFSGILPPLAADWALRGAFLAGAVAAPAIAVAFGATVPFAVTVPGWALVVSGLLVGVGVTLASGCTSGHGVCGLARLSPRSAVATVTFMVAAFATVYVLRHIIAG